MVPLVVQELVRRIHGTDARIVLAANGGISGLAILLEEVFPPRALLEVVVPRTSAAIAEFLNTPCESSNGVETARALAMAAFLKARRYAQANVRIVEGNRVIGAACVATPQQTQIGRSNATLHVAIQTADYTRCATLELNGGARSFHEEDYVAGRLLMNELAIACDLEATIPLGLMVSERVEWRTVSAEPAWKAVFVGDAKLALVAERADMKPSSSPDRRRLIFPGAFNPLHHGHCEMATAAERRVGQHVEFELSILNVDKLPLDYLEVATRLGQFQDGSCVWITRAARFTEKADLFPGATFVVGIDTIRRFANVQYYAGMESACQAAIQHLADRKCRFLVFGRASEEGFQTLSQLEISPKLRELCDEVSEAEFRNDVSSTKLRTANQ